MYSEFFMNARAIKVNSFFANNITFCTLLETWKAFDLPVMMTSNTTSWGIIPSQITNYSWIFSVIVYQNLEFTSLYWHFPPLVCWSSRIQTLITTEHFFNNDIYKLTWIFPIFCRTNLVVYRDIMSIVQNHYTIIGIHSPNCKNNCTSLPCITIIRELLKI